jgi:hypothetical protein
MLPAHLGQTKQLGHRLVKRACRHCSLRAITTEEVLHAQTARLTNPTHTPIMGRGYDTCGLLSSYAGYAARPQGVFCLR